MLGDSRGLIISLSSLLILVFFWGVLGFFLSIGIVVIKLSSFQMVWSSLIIPLSKWFGNNESSDGKQHQRLLLLRG